MGGVALPELKQCVLSSRALARSRVLSRARRRIVATSTAADVDDGEDDFGIASLTALTSIERTRAMGAENVSDFGTDDEDAS